MHSFSDILLPPCKMYSYSHKTPQLLAFILLQLYYSIWNDFLRPTVHNGSISRATFQFPDSLSSEYFPYSIPQMVLRIVTAVNILKKHPNCNNSKNHQSHKMRYSVILFIQPAFAYRSSYLWCRLYLFTVQPGGEVAAVDIYKHVSLHSIYLKVSVNCWCNKSCCKGADVAAVGDHFQSAKVNSIGI